MEISRLCNRWAELEVLAAKQFDYFNMNARRDQRLADGA
jgi:hypothetical protein